MVIPVGERFAQQLYLLEKKNGQLKEKRHAAGSLCADAARKRKSTETAAASLCEAQS